MLAMKGLNRIKGASRRGYGSCSSSDDRSAEKAHRDHSSYDSFRSGGDQAFDLFDDIAQSALRPDAEGNGELLRRSELHQPHSDSNLQYFQPKSEAQMDSQRLSSSDSQLKHFKTNAEAYMERLQCGYNSASGSNTGDEVENKRASWDEVKDKRASWDEVEKMKSRYAHISQASLRNDVAKRKTESRGRKVLPPPPRDSAHRSIGDDTKKEARSQQAFPSPPTRDSAHLSEGESRAPSRSKIKVVDNEGPGSPYLTIEFDNSSHDTSRGDEEIAASHPPVETKSRSKVLRGARSSRNLPHDESKPKLGTIEEGKDRRSSRGKHNLQSYFKEMERPDPRHSNSFRSMPISDQSPTGDAHNSSPRRKELKKSLSNLSTGRVGAIRALSNTVTVQHEQLVIERKRHRKTKRELKMLQVEYVDIRRQFDHQMVAMLEVEKELYPNRDVAKEITRKKKMSSDLVGF